MNFCTKIIDSFSITLNNKAVRLGCDPLGDAQSYALGGAEGYEVTGTLNVLYDDNSDGFLTNSLAAAFAGPIVLGFPVVGQTTINDPVSADGELPPKLLI